MAGDPPVDSEAHDDSDRPAKRQRRGLHLANVRSEGDEPPFQAVPLFELHEASEPFPTLPDGCVTTYPPSIRHYEAATAVSIDFLVQQELDLAGHVIRKESDKDVALNAYVATCGGIGSRDGLEIVKHRAAEQLPPPSSSNSELATPPKHHGQQAAGAAASDGSGSKAGLQIAQHRKAEQVLPPSPSKAQPAAAAKQDGQQAVGPRPPAADSPHTGEHGSVDNFRSMLQEEYKIRGTWRKPDATGHLRDDDNSGKDYTNLTVEMKLELANASAAVLRAALEQGAVQGVVALISNACHYGSTRAVRFVVTDFNLVVIGEAQLTVPCVKQLLKHHRGQPEGVDIERVAGTFRLLYATRNAGIMKPEIGCTCLQALAELFAAALPQCRSWLPEQWHQRRMAAHSGKLRRLRAKMAPLGVLPIGCSEEYMDSLLKRGALSTAYMTLWQLESAGPVDCTGQHEKQGGLDDEVAGLVTVGFGDMGAPIVDAVKEQLRLMPATTLKVLRHIEPEYLRPLALHPIRVKTFIDLVVTRWEEAQQQRQQQQQQQ